MKTGNKNQEVERLLPHLLMNYGLFSDIGIMEGQMGGILFFHIYARKSGDRIYREYCNMLFENIYGRIDHGTSVSFSRGLSGIGWGIEYLVQNKLIEGDTDELLSDIDIRIMEDDPTHYSDFSFMTGLGGILQYVVSRLKSYKRLRPPFNQDYLRSLHQVLNEHIFSPNDKMPDSLIAEFNETMNGNVDYHSPLRFPEICFENTPSEIDNVNDFPLGIYRGITGYALKLLHS